MRLPRVSVGGLIVGAPEMPPIEKLGAAEYPPTKWEAPNGVRRACGSVTLLDLPKNKEGE